MTSRTRPSSAWSRVGLAATTIGARLTDAASTATGRAAPDIAFLVQEFVADGIEVFAGVSRDPDFGLTLAFGMGGIAIEVTRDFALRTLPLREGDAEAMIAETRGAAMLGAIRDGRRPTSPAWPPASMRLPTSPNHNADMLDEIDLNPIKALPAGRGCVVVDALIVGMQPARG